MNIFTNTTSIDSVITDPTTLTLKKDTLSMIKNLQPYTCQVSRDLVLTDYDKNLSIEKNQTETVRFSWRGSDTNQEGIYVSCNNTLQVVADNNTPIPGGKGNFVFFDSFSVSNDNVAFEGFGSSLDQQGIYISSNGKLHVVADRNTDVPNSTGNFIGFSLSHLGLDGNHVAFFAFGSDSQGIYLYCDGKLQVVADKSTPIPGGTGNFSSLCDPVIAGGNVVFIGTGDNRQQGIYISRDNSLQVLVDTNTTIPGESRKFSRFSNIVLYDNYLTFVGYVCISAEDTADEPIGKYYYLNGTLWQKIF